MKMSERVVFSFGGTILTQEGESIRRKPCPISITNLTWTDMVSNPSLRGDRKVTNP